MFFCRWAGYCTKQESNHSSRLCSKLIPMQKNLRAVFSFASVILLMVSISSSQALKGSSDSLSYQSPYKLALTEPQADLLKPNSAPPRDNWRHESSTPYERWYSHRTLRIYKTWGPEARRYPPIAHITELRLSWKRQRVLAVAQQLSDFHTSITIFRIGIRPKNGHKRSLQVETRKAWTAAT